MYRLSDRNDRLTSIFDIILCDVQSLYTVVHAYSIFSNKHLANRLTSGQNDLLPLVGGFLK